MPEARRTVVSNIHKDGTIPAEAGAHIADIIKWVTHFLNGVGYAFYRRSDFIDHAVYSVAELIYDIAAYFINISIIGISAVKRLRYCTDDLLL